MVAVTTLQLETERKEKEAGQRAAELASKALEAEKRLVAAVRCFFIYIWGLVGYRTMIH